MTHDPYQTYPSFGTYPPVNNPGLANPFASPYTAMQMSAFNPAAGNPALAGAGTPWGIPTAGFQPQGAQGYPGIPGITNYAQPQQFASPVGIPQLMGLSPFTNAWQNPLATALQNPLVNILAQLAAVSQPYSPFQQQPYQQQHHHIANALAALGQQVSPFNAPLAPQSWIGQGQAGQIGQFGGGQILGNQGYGQVNPALMQLAARGLQGISPWGGF